MSQAAQSHIMVKEQPIYHYGNSYYHGKSHIQSHFAKRFAEDHSQK